MNRRTLKKLCKRAREVLIERHGYGPGDFAPASGEEVVDAPHGMERRYVRRGILDPGPLKGTPLLWERCSYESDDADAHLPIATLHTIDFWASQHPRDMAAHWAREGI